MAEKRNADLKSVMNKIAKLRELAERGGTLAEAEVASSKMMELLIRHNLSMGDIEQFAKDTGRAVTQEEYDFRANKWRQSLLTVVAEAHLCQSIRFSGFAPRSHWCRMVVVGHEHNLIVVRETWAWLQKEIVRLGNAAVKEAAAAGDMVAKNKPGTWLRDFQLGAVFGIEASYSEMRFKVREEVGERWGLVPVIEGEVAQYFGELFPDAKDANRSIKMGVDASAAGFAAGKGLNLDRQIGGAETAAAIGADAQELS